MALRLVRRMPGATLTAGVSIAVGIAATTAIFSVISALLLRPLPVHDAGRLVRLGATVNNDDSFRAFSHPEFLHYGKSFHTLDGLAGHQPQPVTLVGPEGAEVVWSEIVTGNYFDVLGIQPALGRAFLPDEDRVADERAVVVVGHRFWERRLGADDGIVGRSVKLNGRAFTVVGVGPRGFSGTFPGFGIDLWIPAMMTRTVIPDGTRLERRDDRYLMLLGRVRAGVAREAVQAEASALAAQLAAAFPDTNKGIGIGVRHASGVHPGIAPVVATFLGLLLAIVSLVLVIACMNVANLLLAQATMRQREIAVRRAIGASRMNLVRQLLIESALLAAVGGALGLALTAGVVRVLNQFTAPTGVPIALGVAVDLRVLLFTMAATILAALLFGLAPALQSLKVDVLSALRDESTGRTRARGRRALVAIQIAASLVLLVGAGLVARSVSLSAVANPGFDPEGVMVMSFDPAMLGYSRDRSRQFYASLVDAAAALPGVERVGLASFALMSDRGDDQPLDEVNGSGLNPRRRISYNAISPGFLATIRIPVLRGRDFDAGDGEGAPGVAIVNETFARAIFPEGDALGQQIQFAGAARQIVGVTRDAKYRTFGEDARPFVFLPAAQWTRFDLTLHVRAAPGRPLPFRALRDVARQVDPDVPAYSVLSLRDAMSFALVPAEIARGVLSIAAVIVLSLATVGLYGLVSFMVTERHREIGIRVAVGAAPHDVLRWIVGRGARLALVATAIGLAAAAGFARVLGGFLYGVSPADPAVFAAGAAAVTMVTLLATYLPARRALRLDPAVVLRRE